jgi:DNA-directed RNA polymerase subunit RPC12/RpoP
MKCQHRQLQITEFGTGSTTHYVNKYGEWAHVSDFGAYTGKIEVHCPDCNYRREFTKRRPRWVQEALAEAQKAD